MAHADKEGWLGQEARLGKSWRGGIDLAQVAHQAQHRLGKQQAAGQQLKAGRGSVEKIGTQRKD